MYQDARTRVALREDFEVLAREARDRLPGPARGLVDAAVAAIPDWHTPLDVTDLGGELEAVVQEAYQVLDHSRDRDLYGVALVAELAVGLPERLSQRRLPPDVTALVPDAMDRLLRFLSTEPRDYQLGSATSDYFLKDFRFAAGLTVPIGAGVVDLRAPIGRRRTLALALRRRSLPAVRALLRGRGLEPWFNDHVDSRYLEELDEAGWRRAHLRVASLLVTHPEVRGHTGNGWLYDPQLAVVSPRHAHYRRRGLDGGALIIKGRAHQSDIDNALATSSSRRKAYEEGRYSPTPHHMIWPREEMLAWARRQPDWEPPAGR